MSDTPIYDITVRQTGILPAPRLTWVITAGGHGIDIDDDTAPRLRALLR